MSAFSRKLHAGFTLMEVMVSVSIFAIIMTIGIAALLTISANYHKAETDRQAIDNLTYVLESMSRRIRTAESLSPSTAYGSLTQTLAFTDQDGINVVYSEGTSTGGSPVIEMTTTDPTNVNNDGTYNLTPDKTQISSLTFLPMKGGAGGTGQPYVQINLQGTVTNENQVSDFNFQTAVSIRSFNSQ